MLESEKALTVICVTYGHEAYIEKAIQGVLLQKTDFPVQMFIGEDASPDNTREIIEKYANKYPDKIVPYYRKKNMGALPNYVALLNEVKTRYVAICDGDDYWTDPNKLQKQVDFLEENREFSMVTHGIRICHGTNSPEEEQIAPLDHYSDEIRSRGYLTFDDLFPVNYIASLTVVYRWKFLDTGVPKWLPEMKIGDFPLTLMHADIGKIGVLSECMGVYRKHSQSLWFHHGTAKHRLETAEAMVNLFNKIDLELDHRHHNTLQKQIDLINQDVKDLGSPVHTRILNRIRHYLDKIVKRLKLHR